MDRLINVDAAIKELIGKPPYKTLDWERKAVQFLRSLDTVDAEPIVHAYWEKWTVDIAPHPWHCSKCGFSDHHSPHMDEYCRCPNCGAKMDLEDKK